MTTDESYNGWANRETWAFNLHWQNDQGLYNSVLEFVRDDELERPYDKYQTGRDVVEYVKDMLDEGIFSADAEKMIRDEVGSWWRVDYEETGAAVLESLDAEG